MNKSFSIIIPMYNAENFIESCLDSLVNINYDHDLLQVLIIDDGSSDNSENIIKPYLDKYNFFEYHKKNNGQWGSVINYVKNNSLAKNDYISILDSDDMFTKESLNILNNINNDKDLILTSFARWNGNKITRKVRPYWFLFKKEIKDKRQMHSPYCLPLICFSKKEIFYSLKDIREKVPYQDPDYFSQLVKNSKSLIFTRKITGLYYFSRDGNSITQLWDDKRYESEIYACNKCIENDAQEVVSYRLGLKKMRELMKKKNDYFYISRNFSFKWFPFYIRWIYNLIYLGCYKKYFKRKE